MSTNTLKRSLERGVDATLGPAKEAYSKLGGLAAGVGRTFTGNLKHTGIWDNWTEEELAGCANISDGKKHYKKATTKYEDHTFWDDLYNEPCWIDPVQGSFDITQLGDLWTRWYISKPYEQLKKIAGDTTIYRLNVTKLASIYYKYHASTIKKDGVQKLDDKLHRVLNDSGFYDVNISSLISTEENKNIRGFNVDSIELINNELFPSCDMRKVIEEECIEQLTDLPTIGGILNFPNAITNPDTGDKFSTGGKDFSKAGFCFLFKFILGPAGLLLLKIIPFFVSFVAIIYNFFSRLFIGLYNVLPWTEKSPYIYKDRKGDFQFNYEPGFMSFVATYGGLVIPWSIFSYDHGKKWGNGEFGKFILKLVFLSVGLIFMGGIGTTILLVCFIYYCIKTLSLFTNNIETQGK
tara:strand:+ start:450 stop:1670 length:1221 start_codon:yes stop_codon:yes gene_type:complete